MKKRKPLAVTLEAARTEAGLSLRDAARKTVEAEEQGHGRSVSHQAIHKYENGAMPGADALEALAWSYGMDVGALLSGAA